MTDQFVQVNADGVGKHVDCEELTASYIRNGNTHSNAVIDGLASTAELDAGMSVSGSGIPGGATILSVDSSAQVTISGNASTTLTATPITFSHLVYRQRTVITGAGQAEVAAVKNTAPVGTEYGLVTRPLLDDLVDTFSLGSNATKTIDLLGRSVVGVVIATASGDLPLATEVSVDGTNWASVAGYKLPSGAVISAIPNASAAGTYRFVVAGAKQFRLRTQGGMAGTYVGTLRATHGVAGELFAVVTNTGTFAVQLNLAIPAGTNNIGDVDIVSLPTATSGAPAGVVVSTSAVQIKALNTARKGIEVSNTGTSNIYIGTSSSVTATAGANQGQLVMPGFAWMPPCPYTGAVYGISDQVSAVENVSVLELT